MKHTHYTDTETGNTYAVITRAPFATSGPYYDTVEQAARDAYNTYGVTLHEWHGTDDYCCAFLHTTATEEITYVLCQTLSKFCLAAIAKTDRY